MSDKDGASLTETPVSGSEEDYEVTCDPCLFEDQRVHAIGHCVDCNQNICASCIKVHKKIPSLKDHAIQNNTTLSHSKKSKATSSKSPEEKDPLAEPCPRHQEELIKFYCKSHAILVCSVCATLDHRECKDIDYIREISSGTADSDELRNLQFDLQMLVAKLTSIKSRADWIKHGLIDSYMKAVSNVSDLKRKIVERVNRLEKELLDTALRMKDDQEAKLDQSISAFENGITESEEIIKDLENKKRAAKNNSLFILVKQSQIRLRALMEETNEVSDKMLGERLAFRQSDEQVTLSDLSSLGVVSLDHAPTDVKASHQHDINIKTDTDTDDCSISAITALADGSLALADNKNMSVKLVDVTQCKVTAHIKLESNPIDLTTLSCGNIAVTLNGQRYLQVLSVLPLDKAYTIAVPDLYSGILHVSGKLFLACIKRGSGVHVCNMTGALLQRMETDHAGHQLFTCPRRLVVSPDHGTLLVTDKEENTVVSLTLDGRLISKYPNDRLKKPWGVAINDCGCVLVCSYDDHSVQQMSPAGRHMKALLIADDGIVFPRAVAHSNNHIYISSSSTKPAYRNNIKVYSLEM